MTSNRNGRDSQHHELYMTERRPYQTRSHKKGKVPLAFLLFLDLLGVGVVMGVFCLFFFMIPRAIDTTPIELPQSASPATSAPATAQSTAPAVADPTATAGPTSTPQPTADPSMWGAKFADKFIDGDPVITDSSYRSHDISVTIEKNQENGVTWYVADIYVRDLNNFRTALAKDTYGKGITDTTLNMSVSNNAIVGISGDYYGFHETGIVVRNGLLYRKTPLKDVLLMNNDGTMQTFESQDFNADEVLTSGAWQAWCFGPMLLDDGQVMTKFNSDVNPANPRAAIGYYEPGHYCLVLVDGRQPGYSDGITLKAFSQLFYDMGCKAAYNLDGGQTAVMTFMGEIVNQPYKGGRNVSDIVYIGEDAE